MFNLYSIFIYDVIHYLITMSLEINERKCWLCENKLKYKEYLTANADNLKTFDLKRFLYLEKIWYNLNISIFCCICMDGINHLKSRKSYKLVYNKYSNTYDIYFDGTKDNLYKIPFNKIELLKELLILPYHCPFSNSYFD